jgi:acetyl-CoA carboxylase biotin carboxyl carrier protein
MALSEKEILDVLELFQKSGWEEMQLRSGSLQLSISKTARARPAERLANAPPMSVVARPTPPPHTGPTGSAARPPQAAALVDPRWFAVTAPMLGTFYASPKPGAPPFVSVGQDVAAEDTVAILEVMKLMNHIKAGMRGRIAQIMVGNGDLVEFEQVLIYIDPADRSS